MGFATYGMMDMCGDVSHRLLTLCYGFLLLHLHLDLKYSDIHHNANFTCGTFGISTCMHVYFMTNELRHSSLFKSKWVV